MRTVLICIIYLVLVNVWGLYLMATDKARARRHAFRVPETALFATALIGGSVGSLAGMYLFRHKTKHPSFVIGMPVILGVQVLAVLVVMNFFELTFL